MEIIFVRHGESESNALPEGEQIYTGQWDCPLTERGLRQARALAGDPVFDGADAFFVSDLKRAVQTAEAIAARDWIVDPRLRERSMGDFEGRKIAEIMRDARYEKYFRDPAYTAFRGSFTVKAPNGESYADVCRRVRPFLEELFDRGPRKAVVVGHIIAIRCMLKELLGLSEEQTLSRRVPNCSPIRINCAGIRKTEEA